MKRIEQAGKTTTTRATRSRKDRGNATKPATAGTKLTSSLQARSARPAAKAKRGAATPAAQLIDERIRSLGGWRAQTLAAVRRLIHEADPDVIEECKWIKPSNPSGVPVWSHAGIVCTGEAYKQAVKLTFARGATLDDPYGLFNASLEGSTRRAIDLHEGAVLDAEAFKALIRAAVAQNLRAGAPKSKSAPAAHNRKRAARLRR